MTTQNDRGFAPSIADMEFDQLCIFWLEEHGISAPAAKWLALYQYTGGNAFGLVDMDGRYVYSPRGES